MRNHIGIILPTAFSLCLTAYFPGTQKQAHAQQIVSCPLTIPDVPATTVSGEMLNDVCIPEAFPSNPIDFFDDYSWRAFLALVWPAKDGERGKPDLSAPIGKAGSPLVFETFKSEWEIFQRDGAVPAGWNEIGSENPCAMAGLTSKDLVLAAFSKFANVGQAGAAGDLVGPLVGQNKTYVRFQTAFNQVEFDHIVDRKLYRRENVSNVVFENGAVDLKASWILMDGVANPERFYTRHAFVMNLETDKCEDRLVGLVGLHIVHKTPSRPQWIWSTFEHADNVPESGGTGHGASFNAGDGVKMPDSNPFNFPPSPQAPAPFNVERIKPIHSQTEATNARYREALAAGGSVWQNYKLVMTQWPLTPNAPEIDGKPPNTFPGKGTDTTSFANTTLETFEQKKIVTGCMNCHNTVQGSSDFLWTLSTRSWPSLLAIVNSQPPSPGTLFAQKVDPKLFTESAVPLTPLELPNAQLNEFLELRELLQSAHDSN
ncbi:hypothetical protein [Mesorhizobium sp. IMUNJ 23232]|uniref:hypothetical protein n=1 Tax=Mesorhizobium sp. IMUNJ 23232 TaxID=3376064 RepID=UPI0037AD20FD